MIFNNKPPATVANVPVENVVIFCIIKDFNSLCLFVLYKFFAFSAHLRSFILSEFLIISSR